MPREIDCPTCNSKLKVIKNEKKKTEINLSWLFGSAFAPIKIDLSGIKKLIGADGTPVKEVLDEKCPTCGGKGKIKDPTDNTKEQKQAAEAAKREAAQIAQEEAKLGPPGGNRHLLIVGDAMTEVGLGMNDSESYKIIKDSVPTPGVAEVQQKGTVPVCAKTSAVVGANCLPTPGGHYVIKCSNKFSLLTGAQGIDLNSYGPINIAGGITKITCPEITLGSSIGTVNIEGDHVRVSGKSLSLCADSSGGNKGRVAVQGTLTTSGNIVAAGGAHIEGDLSFISATCPGRTERSTINSASDQVTGPAQWSSRATMSAVQDLIRKTIHQATDPSMLLMSPRGMTNMMLDVISLVKKAIPIEMVVTGFAVGVMPGLGIAPVYNFPHHHTMPDGAHCHETRVPNMRLLDSDEEVRAQSGKLSNAPIPQPANEEGGGIMKLMSSVYKAIGKVIVKRITP